MDSSASCKPLVSARLGRKKNGGSQVLLLAVLAGQGRCRQVYGDSDGEAGGRPEPEWPQQMSGYSSFWGCTCLNVGPPEK